MKESLWRRIRLLFFVRHPCDHVWGYPEMHDVFYHISSKRRPVECEKCYTLRWVDDRERCIKDNFCHDWKPAKEIKVIV